MLLFLKRVRCAAQSIGSWPVMEMAQDPGSGCFAAKMKSTINCGVALGWETFCGALQWPLLPGFIMVLYFLLLVYHHPDDHLHALHCNRNLHWYMEQNLICFLHIS